MFIKWLYCDHGFGGFKESEIPDDFGGMETVEDYICEMGWVPTHGSRFMMSRIKWEKVEKTNEEMKVIIQKKIEGIKLHIKFKRKEIKDLEKSLDNL